MNLSRLVKSVSIAAICLGALSFGAQAAVISYNDRTAFQSQLTSSFTDDYSAAGYENGDVYDDGPLNMTDIFSDGAMSGVHGETRYQTTSAPNSNNVLHHLRSDGYSGNNYGSFLMDFTSTSFGGASGVFGVGFDIILNSDYNDNNLFRYIAYVTFGDGQTQNYTLEESKFTINGENFFGLTSDSLISSIHIGLADGGVTEQGFFEMSNLTIGSGDVQSDVPAPAGFGLILLGLLGIGAFRLLRRH